MAQQTQAARAAEYWVRFMIRFPTVAALAAAAPADVLRAWQGLGYDRRGLALWRSARVIVTEHGGRVPASVEALRALPGVGPYTARAVAALAFGMPVGAVDVNVRRVLGRMTAGGPDALDPAVLQAVADAAVPTDQPATWTHALMDVGATLCKPRAPACGACPARPWCRYAAHERPAAADREPPAVRTTGTARGPAIPFPSTTRWLRGRILDRLRAVDDASWVTLEGAIGAHGPERVRSAATALARDGMLELEEREDATIRARLPLA
jgi:A/G-specific adenine glycosylase